MDSSVVIQEASNGTLGSSEQQPDLEVKSTMEGEDLNLLRGNNSQGLTEGDTSALKSSQDPCANGPTSYDPEQPVPLGPTVTSRAKEPASGVLGFREHLKASQGDIDESLALRKDALQSLKLSLPLQETELCSTDAPLPLEKEEVIRLQARKRLEEQLKQYRVKRHQERVTKSRPSSTLDPELMWNPEILPRASPVAMTKEYSFLRTSVPRGPKVGSLGLPASLKEKKSSKSSRTSRIRSLADYRTENPDGSASGTVPVADCSGGSLKPNSNSLTSVVSSISLSPDSDDRLEASSLAGDSVSEMDGSEAGMRLDGNESDSSTYSSVSGRGLTSSSPQSKSGMAFTINGQVIPLDAVGQFPSIREVLQAAATEQRAQDQEVNGEARSRRDSISSSISMESSVAGTHDELLQVLKEKMRLEGQLEALSVEANEALKEKAELQAQLAAVQMKLQTLMEHSQTSQQKQDSLNSEVATLKQSCWELERAMAELQTTLETKNAGLVASHNDLQLAEEQYQRLMGKVEDLQKNVLGKDSMVHDLRQQLSSLQSQLQQVELDRASLTGKLKSSQAEISSLQKVRHWYQQQLTVAQQARIRLQSDMANIKAKAQLQAKSPFNLKQRRPQSLTLKSWELISSDVSKYSPFSHSTLFPQAGQMTQVGLLEHLKLENVTLSHQLTETQHRSIKEKERIAAQLQNIEADMLDQEAAFLQIQEAKSMVEDDLQRKLEEFEEEKEQLQKMADSAAALEQELEKVKLTLQQRDLQVETLQQEQLDLMRQLTSTQETLQTRDQTVGELQVRYDELEARLAELQGEAASKDDSIRYLQNEKIVLEVALQVAKAGQEGLKESIQHLGGHTEAASDVENLQQESANLKKQTQKVKEQYLQQKMQCSVFNEGGGKMVCVATQLQEARGFRRKIKRLEEANKKLSLELEHERGKLTGLGQSNAALREHNRILEVALAKREADLVQLNLQSAHNRRHYKAAALELSEVKRELQAKEVLIQALQVEVDKLQGEDGKHSEEVSQIQRELVDARSQLQLLQKQLDDHLDKQPVENQELEDLKWEVEQKERELQALKQQLDLTEQRSQKELEGVQLVLQKDKFMLQVKMSELKNSIKTLLQQNQQLKLDLKQGKTKKKLKGETGSNPVTPVKIPDCPVPAALLEELLKPPSAVSKEPLRNLNSCLQQLRLQRQMEEHTVTVHESMSSWTQIEGQLTDLTTNLSVTLLANESLPHRDLQDHKPSTDVQEEVTQ
ncbi:Golgin subfamily A member 3 [Ophiophagus hannah]|uniref:Golgin subfamily A member 3 n=1 Tax=Ophiophagus hannah TaxID=8665 RepID=V8NLM4_OPHHA|nr:Golgin subfamily A member 3 [Ophiophagus hannah]